MGVYRALLYINRFGELGVAELSQGNCTCPHRLYCPSSFISFLFFYFIFYPLLFYTYSSRPVRFISFILATLRSKQEYSLRFFFHFSIPLLHVFHDILLLFFRVTQTTIVIVIVMFSFFFSFSLSLSLLVSASCNKPYTYRVIFEPFAL